MKTKILLLFSVIVGLFLSACSGADHPESLEPAIEMLPATDVTRMEAVVSVRVENRGTGHLSYICFHYGETGKIDKQTEPVEPPDGVTRVTLRGLKPGREYSCYAEGGTATATLQSQIITFTTEPNSIPSLSGAQALSRGPIGVIVGFEILENGGEPIVEAGCEIENTATGEKRRVYLPAAHPAVGPQKLNILGLSIETRYVITPFASNSVGEGRGQNLEYTTGSSILLEEAGVLSSLLGHGVNMEKLVISGDMNGDDFRFLRGLLGANVPGETVECNVSAVDLTDVRIVAGGDSYDGAIFTEANVISTYLFGGCTALREISLPATAIRMARDAFAGCTALETLTIPAGIAELLPSKGCTALRAIEVSRANANYAAVDGVLFNSDVTEILWFPLGKTGEYELPSTVTTIGESAFAETSFTGLVVPSSVTAISRGAFAGSSLTEISLPDNITNISEGMFQNCASLTTVHLGTGTEFIGNYAFDGTALSNLYVAATLPPVVADDAFVNKTTSITADCTLHVPAGCMKYYRSHSVWRLFERIEEF